MHVLRCHSLDSILTSWSSGWRGQKQHKIIKSLSDIATKLYAQIIYQGGDLIALGR